MGLLSDAASDVRAILEDTDGFGLEMTVSNPDQESATITGIPADIGQQMDPETAQAVSGRTVHVALPLAALASLGTPRGIHDERSKPWLVTMQLPGDSAARTYKVIDTMPDKIGVIVCILSDYQT